MYDYDTDPFRYAAEQEQIQQLKEQAEKIEALQEKVFKNAQKAKTRLGQQILLLHKLGFLDKLKEQKLTTLQEARLLSVLLNGDKDNIRKHLTVVGHKESTLTNERNYKFLVDIFTELKLDKLEFDVQKNLNRIQDKKD